MGTSRKPSKTSATRAAKVLTNKSSSKSAKTAAGKTLAKWGATKTRIKSAPKRGNVSKASIKRAVRSVSTTKKASSKKR